ncbi:hypothetical protein ACFL4E_01315 [Candidatus Omnitrophota bacterium]
MKPRKNYRGRPKKHGAAKRQRILSQKKRLVAAGYDMETLRHMNVVQIRDLVKKVAKKKSPKQPAPKKVAAKKAAAKKPAAKKPAAKNPAAKKPAAKKPAKKD